MTYEERVDMITRVLMDEGLGSNEFAVIPFPIETPERLKNYLPTTVPIFTTVYDDWKRVPQFPGGSIFMRHVCANGRRSEWQMAAGYRSCCQ